MGLVIASVLAIAGMVLLVVILAVKARRQSLTPQEFKSAELRRIVDRHERNQVE